MKNDYKEALREAFLKSAVIEAAEREAAEAAAMDIEVPEPTEEELRAIDRIIRDMDRKKQKGQGRVWRAVAMIAVVFALTFGIIMMQPTVRASVLDVVISFFEKYFSFDFDTDAPKFEYALGDYTVTYVPDGYLLDGVETFPSKTTFVFRKGEKAINIILYPSSFSQANVDTEISASKSVRVGILDGYLNQYKNKEFKQLIWGDETHCFMVRGELSEEEILKIAKNIK